MNTLNYPLRFHSYLRPTVWGGRALGERLGKRLPSAEPYGESWELSDHPLHRSVVAAGPCQGTTIRQLMEHHGEALVGSGSPTTFPWLIKFLDVADWLSVQVHPDDEAAKRLCPGEGAKTECWFVLEARPGSRIYAGLMPGVGPAELRSALQEKNPCRCLHSFEPHPGDFLFLPAGTVHAVGGGVLLAEIQQTSDATFRLFDWNRRDTSGRSRELHIEQALASIDWEQGPVQPIRSQESGVRSQESGIRDRRSVSTDSRLENLVSCPAFRVAYRMAHAPFVVAGTGRTEALVALAGAGRLNGEPIHVGEVWLLPAAMERATCSPEPSLSLLECRMP